LRAPSLPEREKADGRYATGLLLQLPAPQSGSAAIRFLTQALPRQANEVLTERPDMMRLAVNAK